MQFWKRVDALLKLRKISRKELALACDFDVSNIGKGIVHENEPKVSTAFKIARFLGVPLEELISEKEISEKFDYSVFQKYADTVRCLEMLPPDVREPILEMIKSQSRVKESE